MEPVTKDNTKTVRRMARANSFYQMEVTTKAPFYPMKCTVSESITGLTRSHMKVCGSAIK